MLNFQTIEFIGLLNELAEKTKVGFFPFSKATAEQEDGILYDDKNKGNNGKYPVIANYSINELHHDIISLYSDKKYSDIISLYSDENYSVIINAVVDNEEPYIIITFESNDMMIIVEEGRWHCC